MLLHNRGDEVFVGVEQGGAELGKGLVVVEVLALDGPSDRIGMNSQLAHDGADAPMLGKEEPADARVYLGRDHRATSERMI